jgi:hypothetical protein
MFPEAVVMKERERFRDDGARLYEEMSGGLNKMTVSRYFEIINASGLRIEYLKYNQSKSKVMKLFSTLGWVPLVGEYFTQSINSILRLE